MALRLPLAVLAAVLASIGYILGGGLIYTHHPPSPPPAPEAGAPAVPAGAYQGLAGSAVNATIERRRVVVEGRPQPVRAGHTVLPVVDGWIVVPARGEWRAGNASLCPARVVEEILSSDSVHVSGYAAKWYVHGMGWESVVVAEEVWASRGGTTLHMVHAASECPGGHAPGQESHEHHPCHSHHGHEHCEP